MINLNQSSGPDDQGLFEFFSPNSLAVRPDGRGLFIEGVFESDSTLEDGFLVPANQKCILCFTFDNCKRRLDYIRVTLLPEYVEKKFDELLISIVIVDRNTYCFWANKTSRSISLRSLLVLRPRTWQIAHYSAGYSGLRAPPCSRYVCGIDLSRGALPLVF